MSKDRINHSSPEYVTALASAVDGHEQVIDQFLLELGNSPEKQVDFIGFLFDTMSIEGNWDITNNRNAAFSIFSDPNIEPILKANPRKTWSLYNQAIKKQDFENDPFSGSIANLLDAGKLLVSIMKPYKSELGLIKKFWQKVADDMMELDEKQWIQENLSEIEKMANVPRKARGTVPQNRTIDLDKQVLALSQEGIPVTKIAIALDKPYRTIVGARQRLMNANLLPRN